MCGTGLKKFRWFAQEGMAYLAVVRSIEEVAGADVMQQTIKKIITIMIITTALLVSVLGCTEQPPAPEPLVPPEDKPIGLIDWESKIPPD
jgi:hypothetical protein